MRITINRMSTLASRVRAVSLPRRKLVPEPVVSAPAFRAVVEMLVAGVVRSAGLAGSRVASTVGNVAAAMRQIASVRQLHSLPEGGSSSMLGFMQGAITAGAGTVRIGTRTVGGSTARVAESNAGQAVPRSQPAWVSTSIQSQRAASKPAAQSLVVANPPKEVVICAPASTAACPPLPASVLTSPPAHDCPSGPPCVLPSIPAIASVPAPGVRPAPNAHWKPGMPWIVIGEVVSLRDAFAPNVVITFSECVPVAVCSLVAVPAIAGFEALSPVQRIKTADGNIFCDSDIGELVQAMASFAPPPASQTSWANGASGQGKTLLTVTH